MANNLSAKKRIRQNIAARLRNRSTKSTVRTAIKSLEVTLKAADTLTASEKLVKVTKLMDTAARKGILSKKAVSRKKSRLSKRLNALTPKV